MVVVLANVRLLDICSECSSVDSILPAYVFSLWLVFYSYQQSTAGSTVGFTAKLSAVMLLNILNFKSLTMQTRVWNNYTFHLARTYHPKISKRGEYHCPHVTDGEAKAQLGK